GLGCALGCLSHTALATLGVSALIAASPLAFTTLKLCGGLYLVWLGTQALRSSGGARVKSVGGTGESLSRLFAKGLIANGINPKVVLFFLSFLPQFVIVERGAVSWQTAQLGLLFTAQAVILFGLLGYFSGAVGQWLNRTPRAGIWLDRVAGTVFVALGLRLIVSR
ncbi:MAG: LysE family translocator, partial [Burkholderiaceae bacterium]